jgi:hypothetical protein
MSHTHSLYECNELHKLPVLGDTLKVPKDQINTKGLIMKKALIVLTSNNQLGSTGKKQAGICQKLPIFITR